MTREEVREVWIAQGGPIQSADLVAEIAWRESRFKPDAHRVSDVEDSRGLMQINVRAHPQYRRVNLYDPIINMRAALAVSNGGRDFSPWSTYNDALTALSKGVTSLTPSGCATLIAIYIVCSLLLALAIKV